MNARGDFTSAQSRVDNMRLGLTLLEGQVALLRKTEGDRVARRDDVFDAVKSVIDQLSLELHWLETNACLYGVDAPSDDELEGRAKGGAR